MRTRPRTRLKRLGMALIVVAVLSATLCLYWRADLIFDMANQLWRCL